MVVGNGFKPFLFQESRFLQDFSGAFDLILLNQQAGISSRGHQHRGAFALKEIVDVFTIQHGFDKCDVAGIVRGKTSTIST